jgi:hypothetical protein
MNLVKQILDQLSGSALGQLGSLLGTDTETTERAATAAVPSLLSALSGLASTDDGARKLTNTLEGLDTGGLGNIAQMLGGNSGSVLSKGNSLLGSLFGDSLTSGLAGALSRYSGLSSSVIKNMLGYLTPLVLGKVATQWRNQGGTSNALKSLFADQRENIADAVPAGFSLADIPGVGEVKKAAYNTVRKATPEPVSAGSPAMWLIPLAIALLGGYFLWQYMSRRPGVEQAASNTVRTTADDVRTTVDQTARTTADEVRAMKPVVPDGIDVPSITGVRDELTGMFKSLDTAFTDIRDAASAERAMPALRELNTKIDTMNQTLTRLPEAGRATLRPVIEEQVNAVAEKARAASAIEGIGAEIKALIQEILAKLTRWITPQNQ